METSEMVAALLREDARKYKKSLKNNGKAVIGERSAKGGRDFT
jgi:hypothetical protein